MLSATTTHTHLSSLSHLTPRSQIHAVFGSALKSYGEDFGARNEGRRYFVPEYTYTDEWDGQSYTRCVCVGRGCVGGVRCSASACVHGECEAAVQRSTTERGDCSAQI